MPKPSSLSLAKTEITAVLSEATQKVYSESELSELLNKNGRHWNLARTISKNDFITFLKQHGLSTHKFRSIQYGREITRYAWGNPSRLELALAINPRGYLSHGTAAKLHGLSKRDLGTTYLNIEQSPKPPLFGRLTQDGLDLAFSRQQRTSNLIYAVGNTSVTVIAGKHTNQLGTQKMTESGAILRVTNLERTLIDLVVRPVYAGGPPNLLRAYRAAIGRVSIGTLLATLQKLDYAYPYHQTIGFLMSKAGYRDGDCAMFAALPIKHDFYLAHGMTEPNYDSQWRLYYPKNLRA